MKDFFQKLLAAMRNERIEKALVIALPCVAVLVCAIILAPQISAMNNHGAANQADLSIETPNVTEPLTSPSGNPTIFNPPQATVPVVSPSPSPAVSSPSPSPSTKPEGSTKEIATKLKADAGSDALYITVCDANGKAITGKTLTLNVKYPDGNTYSFKTDTDGDCYLVRLEAGEYTVSMKAQSGYSAAAAIKRTVTGSVDYIPIKDIEAVVEVVDASDVISQVKPDSSGSAPNKVVIEEISTPGDVPSGSPVLDSNGNPTYKYEFKTGPNGTLFFKGTDVESGVIPVDEGYGVIYGLVFQADENGASTDPVTGVKGNYNTVELINADNSPVADYEIVATPILGDGSSKAGWKTENGKTYYLDADGNKVTGLKRIDGELFFFDANGVRASAVGIDVSFYNEDINWSAVKAQGIDYAIIRLGGRTWRDGTLYRDDKAEEYIKGAKNAGIKIGAYFYSTAITEQEAVEEASLAIEILDGVSLDYPLYFDVEHSGIYPEARSDELSAAQRAKIAVAFCETVANGGYTPGVYSNQNFLKSDIDYSSIEGYSIWLASYTRDYGFPNFSKRYDMWQFTDRGPVNGISGDVDMNVIF